MRATRRGRWVAGSLAAAVVAGATVVVLGSGSGPVVVSPRCTATVDGASHDLAPDQAGNAATIAALAVRRQLPARAVTIAIATAVQESGLRNIDYGDRDSLGLFQQRPSQGWGTPEQVLDVVYATNAFYDGLVEVEGYEALEITDAAQRVQRSAFPNAYGDHEPEGRVFASALTGYSPAALTCRLRPASGDGDVESLAALLRRDFGEELSVDVAEDGASLEVDLTGATDGGRRAWAVAQWAVAQADGTGVVRVATDGREWRRDEPGAAWAASDDAPAAGLVTIEVHASEV